MPLLIVPSMRVVPKTPADWDRFFRSVKVEPDDGSTGTAALENNSVTNAKLRDSAPVSVIGRSVESEGDPADIPALANNTFLVRRTTLGFGPLLDADIPAAIARKSELIAHEAEADPHPGYLLESTAVATLETQAWDFTDTVTFSGDLGLYGAPAVSQPAAIADAETSHDIDSTFSDTEVEAALDAQGATINQILAALRSIGVIAT